MSTTTIPTVSAPVQSPAAPTAGESSGRITVGKTFTGLPPRAQGIIAVTIVGLAAVGIYKLYKAGQGLKDSKNSRNEVSNVAQEFDQLANSDSTKPTLTKSQMAQYANQLFQAMDGYGTSENTIVNVFNKVKNDADLLGIIAAYGVREVSSGRLNPEPNLKGTLAEALTSELSDWWIQSINKNLSAKKIKYQFA